MKRGLALALCVMAGLLYEAVPSYAVEPVGEAPQLVKVVVLSRHGVRSPTQTKGTLEGWSTRDWPEWPVQSGELTPRGAALVSTLWKQEGAVLRQAGLLPKGCPPAGSIVVRADPEQRTRATAEAILAGLVPDCGLSVVQSSHHPDPLFHPVEAGVCGYDADKVRKEIPQSAVAALEESLAAPLGELGAVAGTASPAYCQKHGLPEGCSFVDVPSHLTVDKDAIHLEGRLGIAGSLAEIMLLEYGQWDRPAGWGTVNEGVLQSMLPVHSQTFDLVGRAPSVAASRGSALLLEMADVLASQSADPALNAAKLVVFVGHDTNIAAVGGLLDLEWRLSGYAAREIPPASALVLSLWKQQDSYQVRVEMIGQSLATLHDPKMQGDMVRQELVVPWCDARVEASPCSLMDFGLLTREVLLPQCIPAAKK